jgi:DNA-binding transcriptional LysR family regulator
MGDQWTTIRRVEAFCAVADTRGWKQASARLSPGKKPQNRIAWHLVEEFARDLRPDNPPALFETVPIDERADTNQSVRLSPDGQAVLPFARELLAAARSLRWLLRERVAPLRLGCYPAHLRKVVAPLLAAEEAQLDIVAADDALRVDGGKALFQMLADHQVDVVIAPLRQEPHLASCPLYRWELRVVIPKRFPLADASGPVDVSDLVGLPVLVSPPTHTSRQITERVFRGAGLTLEPRYENPSTESLLAYVDAGLGVAILPEDSLWPSRATRVERPFAPNEALMHALHWRAGEERHDQRLQKLLAVLATRIVR